MFDANGKRIVLHEDIDDLCNRFSTLTDEFNDSLGKITDVLSNITDSYRRSGGKGTVVETCRGLSTNLFSVCETLITGNELLKMSKEQTRNIDAVICDAIRNQEFSELVGFDYYEPSDNHTEVWESEKAYWDSLVGTHYVNIFDENGNVRPPYNKYIAYGRYTFGNEADTMQCVGYAWARFEELSGVSPGFSCGYAGNIGNCYPDSFEQVTDFSALKVPALAYTGGNPGHVVVVEKFTIGPNGEQIVYYTHANASGQLDGTMQSSSFDSFTGIIQLK